LTASDLPRNMLLNVGKMKIDFSKGMKPETVAQGILRALSRGTRETVMGWEARWILFGNRWMPRLANWLIARKVRRLYAS
jgi:hypothetical protein